MQPLTLSQAAISFGGTLMHPDCRFETLCTDSRAIQPGQLFVALEGERFDAHQFLPQVAEQAAGLVVRKPARDIELPQWVVPDTTEALGQIARLRRDQFTGPVIAVTGSSGKTSVKEMLAAILSRRGSVLATSGNLNNHIGVPLTLMGLAENHRFAVVEMGASGPGEIAYLCNIAKPDIVLVNNVMPAHVEGFGSIDGVASAKGEIYQGVSPNGTAVINLDEKYAAGWQGKHCAANLISYSVERDDADLRAANIVADSQGRCRFILQSPAGEIEISLPLSGRHNVANALAAAACATAAGATLAQIADGLGSLQPVAGRLSPTVLPGGATIIDDSYNANPGSMKAAIDTLRQFSSSKEQGHKILVMGDMAELGEDEAEMHGEIGRYAAAHGVDRLFATGPLSANAVTAFNQSVAAGDHREATHFDNKDDLIDRLQSLLAPAMVVLVKGSRSAAMEQVVHRITGEGER